MDGDLLLMHFCSGGGCVVSSWIGILVGWVVALVEIICEWKESVRLWRKNRSRRRGITKAARYYMYEWQ